MCDSTQVMEHDYFLVQTDWISGNIANHLFFLLKQKKWEKKVKKRRKRKGKGKKKRAGTVLRSVYDYRNEINRAETI